MRAVTWTLLGFVGGSVLAVCGASVSPSLPVAAAEPGTVEVLIESVSPAAPTKKSTLAITGRVANSTDTTISNPTVSLRFSPLPLNSREEVDQVLSGESQRQGNAMPDTVTALGTELGVGQQGEFRLTVPIKNLELPNKAAVYAVFVELASDELPLTAAGTMFPWFPKKAEYEPTDLAFVWPITQRPSMAAHDLVVDPALPDEFTDEGRLGRLLKAGNTAPVAWLIDTAVLQIATEMADGYDLETPVDPQPGDKTAAAKAFSEALRAVFAANPGSAVPQFAVADDDALTRGNQTSAVVRSATLPQVVLAAEAKPAAAASTFVAPGGNSDVNTLQTVVDAGVRIMLMSDTVFPPEPATSYTPSGTTTIDVGGTPVQVLLTDSQLGRSLSGPFDTAASRSAATQGFLADSAMITLERPAERRGVVAMPPLDWDPPQEWLDPLITAVTRARWLVLSDLDTIAAAPAVPRARRGYGQSSVRELPQNYVQRIGEQQLALDSLSRIVDDPTGFGQTLSTALQRASSSLWRGNREKRNHLMNTITDQIETEREKVRVVSGGTITLAGDNGFIPLTIANDFDRSVTVGIQLRADNAVRLEYTPPAPIQIGAQAKKGIEVPVRVVGSQPMEVAVVLTDPDGGEYDNSVTLEIRSTAATQIAGVVVGVGGVTLAVLVAFNFWRRRRSAKAAVQQ